MGLDYHGLAFLKYANRQRALGAAVTIGRQEVHVKSVPLKKMMGSDDVPTSEVFCEPLLRTNLGASSVESIDYSGYQHATHVHDMGKPLPDSLRGRYETVIDGGTLEHVFNIVQAFTNCADLVQPGGQILHILPANNYMGHGFWQMSPELFFSLYSEKNGFRETEVFIADFIDQRRWYKVKPPHNGQRVTALSSSELYILVRTVKAAADAAPVEVQQSDYMHEWEKTEQPDVAAPSPGKLKLLVMNMPFVFDRIIFPIYHRVRRRSPALRVTGRNPGLDVVNIKALTG